MKKIAITIMSVIAILAMMMSLTGCGASIEEKAKTDRIVRIDDCNISGTNTVITYFDSETGSMYQFVDGYKNGASMMMYKADGTIAVYNKETNVENRMKLIDDYTIGGTETVYVYYDVVEGCMYQFADGYKNGGATVMYNADGSIATYNAEDPVKDRIKLIDSYSIGGTETLYLYYDTVTGTMYQFVDGYKNGGAVVMRNPDGTITTYEE